MQQSPLNAPARRNGRALTVVATVEARFQEQLMESTSPPASRPLCRIAAALICLLIALPHASAFAQKKGTGEYELKAAFLFNFVKFVKWPSHAFSDETSPLAIGILGNDPFAGALDRTVRGETVGGRIVKVRRSGRVEELRDCQIVFVSRAERTNVGDILAAMHGSAVLTIGETEQFSRQGGVISLLMNRGHVGFEINVAAGRRAGLEISSKLLKLGRVVTSG